MTGEPTHVDALDDEIRRLHKLAVDPSADVFAASLARAQIDELLERRHRLRPGPTEPAPSDG